ncbi:MAG: signal peptidase I, partial [Methanocorpusculum sp.]|nr:signal peptidase I [Methanocorpusculum sp.]
RRKDTAIESQQKTVILQAVIIGIILVVGIGVTVFGVSGTWPFAVAVESDSMSPNLNVGDLVFIVEKDRATPIVTAEEARAENITSFGGYGDVIVYTPNGNTHTTAFIHRVISRVNATEAVDKYGFSPEGIEGGYITKGDNNNGEDQTLAFNGIGRMYPVREDWVVGKAVSVIPFVGFIPMYIWQIAVVVLIILLVWEWNSKRIEWKEKRRG